MKAKRELIRKQYEHGERFTLGERVAEAARIDSCAGIWCVFRYVGGQPVRGQRDPRMTYHEARRVAREWVEATHRRVTDDEAADQAMLDAMGDYGQG